MKILQVAANTRYGGMPFHVLTLSRALIARGHQVEVLSMDSGPMTALFRAEGIPIYTTPELGQKAKRNPLLALRVTKQIRRQISKSAPDIVHSHGPRAHFFSALAVRRRPSPALVTSVHGSYTQFTVGNRSEFGGLKRRIQKLQYGGIDRLAARYSSRMVAVCEATKRELVNDLKIDSAKITVVPNGIEDRRPDEESVAAVRKAFGFGGQERIAVYVGRLAFHKGIADLFAAAEIVTASAPHARFLIVGEGPMEDELSRRVEMGPLAGKVFFAGRREDVPQLIGASDLFVLPSFSEGLPLTLLEAAMVGRAMVATDVGGISDVVQAGVTGTLVRPRDPVGLARGIKTLLGDDTGLKRMGDAARQLWEQKFTADNMVEKMEQVYISAT